MGEKRRGRGAEEGEFLSRLLSAMTPSLRGLQPLPGPPLWSVTLCACIWGSLSQAIAPGLDLVQCADFPDKVGSGNAKRRRNSRSQS